MNAAIDSVTKSKNPTTSPYPDYLKANTRIATDLADEIDATIDYAQNKGKADSLAQQLDSSAKSCCEKVRRAQLPNASSSSPIVRSIVAVYGDWVAFP
ncbi:MAG TPA: hypothetical protein VN875_06585 [Candidatus Binatus sp.]|jgi:hypothetical protein|nr:hypothetical protein [Candidatus Binatus sp.]